jgi:hypothetical protein
MNKKYHLRNFGPRVFLWGLVVMGAITCSGDAAGPNNQAEPFFPLNFRQTYTLVRDCRFSIEHDGHNILVYTNPEAASAYLTGTYPFQQGTVIVKELYRDPNCSDLFGYAAMRKSAPGTAPQSGDWEWQNVGSDGKVQSGVQPSSCISCHLNCTEGRDLTCTDP